MSTPSTSSSSNIMLAIHEKKTVSIDLYRPLRNYIVFTYSEHQAQTLDDDLETLKSMRNSLERSSPIDSLTSRRDLIIDYFKALTVIETRFPISPDKDHVNSLTFTWYDAFKSKNKASQQNIHLEKAAVLFNLGSVHSQIGLGFDRSTVEGRRLASHSFIAAAGAFAFLRDNESTKACVGNSTTVDVSVECAGMLERLMLAQAQECVFENSIAKGSSNGVCSKISKQVSLYYEEALAALNAAPLTNHFDKAWVAHVQLKAALFYAEACYRYSLELHEKEEIAEEIARLKSGIGALTDAKKSYSKGAAVQILDAINKLEINMKDNLERAMKENDRVYLMRVPQASSLPPLPAFAMVKPLNMNEVLDASKEKMFAILVPDSSAKALSRYTEMVDDVIRTQAEKLQQGSELARIESALPTLAKPIMSLDANEDAIVGTLKQSLRQLETLGAQRAGLEDMLKDMKRKAQNREFAATFNIEDYRAACEKCYKQIEAAVAKYREIKENINEGLKFYVTLQDAITSVKQQCSDFVMTRSIQCREMIEDVQRQMSGLSFQDGKNSNTYNFPSTGPPQRTSSQSDLANQPRPQTPYYHQQQ
ncbi:hypothetical protein M8C21_029929, partial [Ambrosia artemisiifolia]